MAILERKILNVRGTPAQEVKVTFDHWNNFNFSNFITFYILLQYLNLILVIL